MTRGSLPHSMLSFLFSWFALFCIPVHQKTGLSKDISNIHSEIESGAVSADAGLLPLLMYWWALVYRRKHCKKVCVCFSLLMQRFHYGKQELVLWNTQTEPLHKEGLTNDLPSFARGYLILSWAQIYLGLALTTYETCIPSGIRTGEGAQQHH